MRRRVGIAAFAAAVATLVVAPPADAHTVSGVKPTNYKSRVLLIRPAARGVTFRVLELGRRVELRNRTDVDVVVLGYYGEPYLRVGPRGGFENRRARTAADNRTTTKNAAVAPAPAADSGPPSWRRVGEAPVVRWRDQRTRYEGAAESRATGPAGRWTIELQQGGKPIVVSGLITYEPPPSAWVWVAFTLLVAGLTTAAAWTKRWGRGLSVALAVLIASDAIHSFGSAAATHESLPAQLAKVLLVGLVTTAAWIVGVAALPSLQRNHEGGLVAAGGVGLVVAAFSGITDIGVFANSQVDTVFPAVTARIAVVMALGLGVGLVLAATAVIARDPALRPTVVSNTAGTDP